MYRSRLYVFNYKSMCRCKMSLVRIYFLKKQLIYLIFFKEIVQFIIGFV